MKMHNKTNRSKKRVTAYILLPLLIALCIYFFVGGIVYLACGETLGLVGMLFGSESYVDLVSDYKAGTREEGTLTVDQISYPNSGQMYAKIKLPGADGAEDLYYGDSDSVLKKGVGQYSGTLIPGYQSPILIAGHNNGYFNKLKNVKKGGIITITTTYGVYSYKITKTAVKDASDESAYDLLQEKEQLILYTCYPFDTLGLTSKRFYVYADYVSGPRIIDSE